MYVSHHFFLIWHAVLWNCSHVFHERLARTKQTFWRLTLDSWILCITWCRLWEGLIQTLLKSETHGCAQRHPNRYRRVWAVLWLGAGPWRWPVGAQILRTPMAGRKRDQKRGCSGAVEGRQTPFQGATGARPASNGGRRERGIDEGLQEALFMI